MKENPWLTQVRDWQGKPQNLFKVHVIHDRMTMSCLNRQLSRKPLLADYSLFQLHLWERFLLDLPDLLDLLDLLDLPGLPGLLDLLDLLDLPGLLGQMGKMEKMGMTGKVQGQVVGDNEYVPSLPGTSAVPAHQAVRLPRRLPCKVEVGVEVLELLV